MTSTTIDTGARRTHRGRRWVPVWVTVLAVALGLFATAIGVLAFVDPSRALGYVPGADTMAITWAGRNLGLGIVLLTAVVLRHPAGYAVAFAGQLFREIGDLTAAFPSAVGMAFTAVFVVVDLAGLIGSVRSLRRTTRPSGPPGASPSAFTGAPRDHPDELAGPSPDG